jgi:diacylglycerol kinase family enzyme
MVAPGFGAGQAASGSLVVVVANPYSGAGPNRRRVEQLTAALSRHGLGTHVTWDPAERRALLGEPDLAGRWRAVVAAGGDGTIADVINDNRAGLPLAVLPIGNENAFAQALGFTGDAQALARAIAAGGTRRIDLGRAGTRLWSLMVSAGIDAEVVHRVARWRSGTGAVRRVTRLRYVGSSLAALARYAYQPIEVDADGQRVHGSQCVVFNVPRYALGLPLAPGGSPSDGLLDWIVLERPGAAALAGYVVAVLRGSHLRRQDLHHGRAARVRIASAAPVPVQVDGEAWGTTPVELEVAPRALTVVAPSSQTEGRRNQ